MKLKKFDILLVKFPFSNLTNVKLRPALVINPLEGENIILCQITTKKRTIQRHEIELNKKSCEGDIRFDSRIYTDMIFTLHKSLVIDKIGHIGDDKVKSKVSVKIRELFN